MLCASDNNIYKLLKRNIATVCFGVVEFGESNWYHVPDLRPGFILLRLQDSGSVVSRYVPNLRLLVLYLTTDG